MISCIVSEPSAVSCTAHAKCFSGQPQGVDVDLASLQHAVAAVLAVASRFAASCLSVQFIHAMRWLCMPLKAGGDMAGLRHGSGWDKEGGFAYTWTGNACNESCN